MDRPVLPAALLVLLGILLWQQQAAAWQQQTVHYVDNIAACQGRAPCYSTIMDAVNVAASGDTVEVFPGVYHETVVFDSKGNLVLQAHQPALKPVIAPSSGNSIVILASPQVQVRNFVIEAGVSIGGPGSSGYVIQGNEINGVRGGVSSLAARAGVVRHNTFVGAGLSGDLNASVIEGNTFIDAGIFLLEGAQSPDDNVIQHNILRRGGIALNVPASGNTIASNFVSGNTGDGISIGVVLHGGINVIRGNTSIENAGCDINDLSTEGGNTWRNNRFGTKCGAASG